MDESYKMDERGVIRLGKPCKLELVVVIRMVLKPLNYGVQLISIIRRVL